MEKTIGAIFKRLRKERGLTLSDVAERTGLSVSYISTVERGVNSPTIANLQAICSALDITMNELLISLDEEHVLVRKDEHRTVFDKDHRVIFETITEGNNHLKGLIMKVYDNRYYPSSKHISDELGYVLKGAVRMMLNGQEYDLSEGDTLYIKANTVHGFQKTSEEECIMLWVYHNAHPYRNSDEHNVGIINMHP